MISAILFSLALAGQEPPPVPVMPISPVARPSATPPATPLPPPPVIDPARPPGIVQRPAWAQKPSGDLVGRYYPDRAMRLAIPGRAVLQCQVRLSGRLEGCTVIEETPAGEGFGTALLRLSTSFRMTPERQDGVEVDGAVVKVPISFTPWVEQPWQGEFTLPQAVACANWHRARLGVLPKDPESLRGAEQFAGLSRKLAPGAGLGDKDIEAALAGEPVEGLLGVPDPASICRVAVTPASVMPVPRAGPAPPPPSRGNDVRKAVVVVRCTANYRTGKTRDCAVVSEDPPGRGFGAAALRSAPRMRLPENLKPKAGEEEGIVELPMTFDLMK